MMSGVVPNSSEEIPRMLMLPLPAPGAPEPPRICRPGTVLVKALATLVVICFDSSFESTTEADPVKALFFWVPKATTMTSCSCWLSLSMTIFISFEALTVWGFRPI